jgi:hypothetical protein
MKFVGFLWLKQSQPIAHEQPSAYCMLLEQKGFRPLFNYFGVPKRGINLVNNRGRKCLTKSASFSSPINLPI